MLDSIKTVIGIKAEIDAVRKDFDTVISKLKETQDSVKALAASLAEIGQWKKDLEVKHDELIVKVSEGNSQVSKLVANFNDELNSFQNVKRQLALQLQKQLEDEIKQKIASACHELELKAADVKSIKSTFDELATHTKEANVELKKFQEIAASVKKQDFDFEHTLKEAKKVWEDRAGLLYKIDQLERMVAGARRKSESRSGPRF